MGNSPPETDQMAKVAHLESYDIYFGNTDREAAYTGDKTYKVISVNNDGSHFDFRAKWGNGETIKSVEIPKTIRESPVYIFCEDEKVLLSFVTAYLREIKGVEQGMEAALVDSTWMVAKTGQFYYEKDVTRKGHTLAIASWDYPTPKGKVYKNIDGLWNADKEFTNLAPGLVCNDVTILVSRDLSNLKECMSMFVTALTACNYIRPTDKNLYFNELLAMLKQQDVDVSSIPTDLFLEKKVEPKWTVTLTFPDTKVTVMIGNDPVAGVQVFSVETHNFSTSTRGSNIYILIKSDKCGALTATEKLVVIKACMVVSKSNYDDCMALLGEQGLADYSISRCDGECVLKIPDSKLFTLTLNKGSALVCPPTILVNMEEMGLTTRVVDGVTHHLPLREVKGDWADYIVGGAAKNIVIHYFRDEQLKAAAELYLRVYSRFFADKELCIRKFCTAMMDSTLLFQKKDIDLTKLSVADIQPCHDGQVETTFVTGLNIFYHYTDISIKEACESLLKIASQVAIVPGTYWGDPGSYAAVVKSQIYILHDFASRKEGKICLPLHELVSSFFVLHLGADKPLALTINARGKSILSWAYSVVERDHRELSRSSFHVDSEKALMRPDLEKICSMYLIPVHKALEIAKFI